MRERTIHSNWCGKSGHGVISGTIATYTQWKRRKTTKIRQLIFRPRFEIGTHRIQMRNATASTILHNCSITTTKFSNTLVYSRCSYITLILLPVRESLDESSRWRHLTGISCYDSQIAQLTPKLYMRNTEWLRTTTVPTAYLISTTELPISRRNTDGKLNSRDSIPCKNEEFSLLHKYIRLSFGPRWATNSVETVGFLSGWSGRACCLPLVFRSQMRRTVTPHPYTSLGLAPGSLWALGK